MNRILVVTGKEFNEKYRDKRMVKLTTSSEKEGDVQYRTGLIENVEIENMKIKLEDYCLDEGEREESLMQNNMLFCEHDKLYWWVYSHRVCIYMRDVTIPDDAEVYIAEDKFSTDKFILGDRTCLWPNQECVDFASEIITHNDPSFDYHYARLCEYAIKDVNNQTPEIAMIAVFERSINIQYVINQTPALCKIAVEHDGTALQYIKVQTPELCKIAVERSPESIRYVKDQTPELLEIVAAQETITYERIKFWTSFNSNYLK